MADGWVKLRRELAEDPIWTKGSFDAGKAWVDLLLQVTYKTHTSGGKRYRAGCVYTSTIALGARWNWTRNKVRWFLKQMEAEKRLKVKRWPEGPGVEIFVIGWNPGEEQPQKHTVKSGKTEAQQPSRPSKQPYFSAVKSGENGNEQPDKQPLQNTVDTLQGISTVEGKDDGVTGGRSGSPPEGGPPRPEETDPLARAMAEWLWED